MGESIQHKLDRVRRPRVQITYDVEIGDAVEEKELPFVVGVLSDLSGDSLIPREKLKSRQFVEVDKENLDDVMEAIGPRLALNIANEINGSGKMEVELNFNCMEDFDPLSIIQQVPELRALYEARKRLDDLEVKLDGNEDLDLLLQDVLENTEAQRQLTSEVKDLSTEAAD